MGERKGIIIVVCMLHVVLVAGGNKTVSMKGQGDSVDQRMNNRHVIKTIQVQDGDVFDCIDIHQQPAFDHPLLKNHVIQMKPHTYPLGVHVNYASNATKSIRQLPTVGCPTGTIPMLQRNIEGDPMKSSHFHTLNNEPNWKLVGIKTSSYAIYGTRVSINVYEPKVKGKNGDFSASWTLLIGEGSDNDGVGAGSIVWPSFHGDNSARFHITWVNDAHKEPCYDLLCPGFVQTSQSIGLGGKIQPISTYNGPQYKIDILIYKDKRTNDWWLAYGEHKTLIGYWPSLLFTGMKDKADAVFWGGYVHGPTVEKNPPQVGSGHFAEEGFGKAAFVRDIKVVNENNVLVTPDTRKSFAQSSRTKCYTVAKYGQNNNGMHVYFGGPGNCN